MADALLNNSGAVSWVWGGVRSLHCRPFTVSVHPGAALRVTEFYMNTQAPVHKYV